MNLPNADQAQVDKKKITEYLMCLSHPDGSNKAKFFIRFGFTIDKWELLADSLKKHATTHPIAEYQESDYGTRYCIDGSLDTPDKRNPLVRTVWILEKGNNIPRLITAYPIIGRT